MIRTTEITDCESLAHLVEVLGYPIELEKVTKNLNYLLINPEHLILVFEQEKRILGYIEAEYYEAVYSSQKTLNILGLAVDTQSQGLGIGGELLKSMEAEAKKRDFELIRLNSGTQRVEAHQFYSKQGYTSNHSQKRFLKVL